MLRLFYTILPVTLLLAMCRKESIQTMAPAPPVTTELSQGLPENPDSIHGYFYSGYNYTRFPLSGTVSTNTVDITLYAQFVDPAENLAKYVNRKTGREVTLTAARGNVGMGNIRYNNYYLNRNPWTNTVPVYYLMSTGYPPLMDYRTVWDASGNEFIPAFGQPISAGYPVFKDTVLTPVMRVKEGFAVNTGDYFDSWDSVVVQLSNSKSLYTGYFMQRSGGSGTTRFVFTPKELDFFLNDVNGTLTIRAFRYFHRTINGRRYLFELSTGVENRLVITR